MGTFVIFKNNKHKTYNWARTKDIFIDYRI